MFNNIKLSKFKFNCNSLLSLNFKWMDLDLKIIFCSDEFKNFSILLSFISNSILNHWHLRGYWKIFFEEKNFWNFYWDHKWFKNSQSRNKISSLSISFIKAELVYLLTNRL